MPPKGRPRRVPQVDTEPEADNASQASRATTAGRGLSPGSSPCWSVFKIDEVDGRAHCSLLTARGRPCPNTYAVGSTSSTHSMWSHLKGCHYDTWTLLSPKMKVTNRKRRRSTSANRVHGDLQNKLDTMVARWLAKSARPASICDDVDLQDIFQYISSGRYLLTR